MLIVHAKAEVATQDLTGLLPALQQMIEASNAEAGCVSYVFAQDVTRADLIHITEAWQDQAALDAHFATAHMAAFQAAIKGKFKIVSGNKYLAGDPLPLRG